MAGTDYHIHPLQSDFSAGEMSPRLFGRSNTELYQRSVAECDNFFTWPHGPAVLRPGYLYFDKLVTAPVRFIDVQVSATVFYEMVVGGDGVRIYDEKGVLLTTLTNPWAAVDYKLIQYRPSLTEQKIYFAHPTVAPQELVITAGPTFVLQAITFTSPPAEWGAGTYPRTLTLYQQRLWFGGSPNHPDWLWGSQINIFFDFSLGTAQPTDAVAFQMSDKGNIVWIEGVRNLLIGTDVGEYIATSVGGTITASDIHIEQQSSYGCADFQPVELGNGVLYVSADSRRVRFMNYQFLEDGWVSIDITWPSEHLTEPLIQEIHFKYSPDPLLWVLLQNGELITATYEREQSLIGWHRQTLAGTVRSMCVTRPEPGKVRAWIGIDRINTGGPQLNLEGLALTEFTPGEEEFTIHLDSSVVVNNPVSKVITGLDHLEGLTVRVLTDSAMEKDKVVVGGQVTAQRQASVRYEVGLAFLGRVFTLPLEGGNRTGTSQGLMKRWARVWLRVLASAIPKLNGIRPGARTAPTPMGERQPYETQDIQYTLLGRNRTAQLLIEQDLPYDTKVLAIFGEVGMTDL